MARRATQKTPQKLGDILQQVLKRQKIPFFFEDQALRRIWHQAVGPQISAQTSPQHIKRGILYVKVATSVWMHQLQFLKDEIREKLNLLSGGVSISALHFSIGEIPRAPQTGKRDQAEPLSPDPLKSRDQRIIKESLVNVADQELKEILRRVMKKEIGRRRLLEKRRDR